MFPKIALEIDNIDITNNDSSYNDVFVFDFEKGDFVIEDGRIKTVNNIEALKLMITKLIKTEKFVYSIYAKEVEDEEFGIVLENLIGRDYPDSFILEYIKSNIEKEILKLKGVDSIDGLKVNKINDKLKIEFTVNHQFKINEVV